MRICHAARCGTFAILLIALSLAPRAFADTIRVTALSLREITDASATNSVPEGKRLEQIASKLAKLDPDVILLRQVRDWQMCSELARALAPADYNVLVCSSFRDAPGGLPARKQVAILSKQRAYISWSDAWQDGGLAAAKGGYVFAAIRSGKERIGFFSAQLCVAGGSNSVAPQSALFQQWQAQVSSLRKWTTNRIAAVVVAGGFDNNPGDSDSGRALKETALTASFFAAPFTHAVTASVPNPASDVPENYLLARLAPNSSAPPGVVLAMEPATCDLDLNPANVAPDTIVATASSSPHPPQSSISNAAAPSSGQLPPATPSISEHSELAWMAQRPWLPAVLAGLAVAGAVVVRFLVLRIRGVAAGKSPAVAGDLELASKPSSETIVIVARNVTGAAYDNPANATPPQPAIHVDAPATTHTQSAGWQARVTGAGRDAEDVRALARSGFLALWSQWLKEKLVRRLIADRTELLKTQHAVTLKAIAVDERLARIELQLQHQYRAYEQRIEELTRELEAAREGNRELIRAQIAQVKAEMDSTRARLMAQMNENENT